MVFFILKVIAMQFYLNMFSLLCFDYILYNLFNSHKNPIDTEVIYINVITSKTVVVMRIRKHFIDKLILCTHRQHFDKHINKNDTDVQHEYALCFKSFIMIIKT